MAEITFLRINGIPLPTPDAPHTWDMYDLDTADTGRPESGVLNRDRKRAKLQRHNFKWSKLKPAEAWLIFNALMPEEVVMTIWTFDRYESRTMYAGDLHWEDWYDPSGEAHISLTVQLSEV